MGTPDASLSQTALTMGDVCMNESRFPLNRRLPQSADLCNGGNIDALRQCIRAARLAARNPDTLPTERHLHRIVASAGLESLHYRRSHRGAHARRAERLLNDAIRQLETIRLEAARAAL